MFQISKPGTGLAAKAGGSSAPAATVRKPAAELSTAASRKPGLGKGVPPPVPPNKPTVPVKKEGGGGGKRMDGGGAKDVALSIDGGGKGSLVTGLQGLKFGISLGGGGGDAGKGLKGGDPGAVGGGGLPAKKFFNNIESKS